MVIHQSLEEIVLILKQLLQASMQTNEMPKWAFDPSRNIMRIFAVSGYSGTGKTTLVEQIISALIREGYKVATVKSTRDDIYEEEGTDSWRHRRAGAKVTIILGRSRSYIILEGKQTLRSLINNIDADYLIIEGMKESQIPKIWCVRDSSDELNTIPQLLKAIVIQSEVKPIEQKDIPVFRFSEIEKIVELIKRESIELSKLKL
jgi:molybdopterin-guanine dinucleotide biosynthesis protein B